MEWSNDLVLEFLMLYEVEPAIWNPKDAHHKRRDLVHEAWKRIEMNLSVKCSVSELKKKKETLMATYRKLSQKVEASIGNAMGSEDIYKPEWFAYETMARFLHGVYKPTDTRNVEVPREEKIDICEEEVPKQSESEKFIEHIKKESINSELSPSSTTKSDYQDPKLMSISKKGRKRKAHTMAATETSYMEEENQESDECSLYGELLARKLRAFDEDTRDFAMLRIDHLIFRLKHEKSLPTNPWFSYYLQSPSFQPQDYQSASYVCTENSHQTKSSPPYYSEQHSP